jgi:uncharacterized protein (TIGR02271 family)
MKTVVGLFDSTNDAQRMLEELMQMGFQADDISIVTNLSSQQMVEAASIHLDAMNVTDSGKIAAAGPLRDTLRHSTGSSLALRGALERSGFPPELADRYAAGVERGGTLESLVVPDSDADRVVAAMKKRSTTPESGREGLRERMAERREDLKERLEEKEQRMAERREEREEERETRARADGLREPGPTEISRATAAGESYVARKAEPAESFGSRGLDADEEWRIPILREELRVGKRAVDRGGVRITVHVVEKPVEEQIHLRETHVEIERRAVDHPPADMPGFRDETIEVAEIGEESVVSKQARVVEEVIVHKHVTDRVETVQESVRETRVDYGKKSD